MGQVTATGSDVDYDKIPLPENTPKEQWSTYERRRWVLDHVAELGNPRKINKQAVADKFDVDRRTIYSDLDVLGDYIVENLDREHVFVADAVFTNAVEELQANGDYWKAAKTTKLWFEWLTELGVIDKAAEKLDIQQSITVDDLQTDAYTIMSDEAAEAESIANQPTPDPADAEPAELPATGTDSDEDDTEQGG